MDTLHTREGVLVSVVTTIVTMSVTTSILMTFAAGVIATSVCTVAGWAKWSTVTIPAAIFPSCMESMFSRRAVLVWMLPLVSWFTMGVFCVVVTIFMLVLCWWRMAAAIETSISFHTLFILDFFRLYFDCVLFSFTWTNAFFAASSMCFCFCDMGVH